MGTRVETVREQTARPTNRRNDRPGDRSHKAIDRPLTRGRLLTGALRVLPDYIIIGAQKCGTSSLYRYINEHPCVAPAVGKEVHYFDWHFRRGQRWYRAHFPTALHRSLFRARTGERLITGEASPYYIFHPHVPARVKDLVPHAKLIALLRDPVERTISAYHHQVRNGVETLSLSEALDSEPFRLAQAAERLGSDESFNSRVHRRYSYMSRGIYADQLDRWFQHFPREQLLILRSEDLFTQPDKVLDTVFEFLGLRRWHAMEFYRFNAGEYAHLEIGVRQRLIDFFAPHNERLYELLGRDLGWLR